MGLGGFRSRSGALALACALFLTAGATSAQAAVVDYPPEEAARELGAGLAGWTSESSVAGTCVPGVTCPVVSNEFVASDGRDGVGDGHLRSGFGSLLSALAATSTATWRSPEFTYQGVEGQEAQELSLSVHRRTDLSTILALTGSSASYAIYLVDGGDTHIQLASGDLPATQPWTQLGPFELAPGALELGESYRLELVSSVQTPALLPDVGFSGWVDWDGVRMRAQGAGQGPGGGQPGKGRKRLARKLRKGVGGTAVAGARVAIRLRCPVAAAPRKCRLRPSVRLGGKAATKAKRVTLRAGKVKAVALKTTPRFREKLLRRKRVVVQLRARIGNQRFVVRKRVRLKRGA